MTITFPYSSAPVRQIKEIQFGVMSPEEIVSWSRRSRRKTILQQALVLVAIW